MAVLYIEGHEIMKLYWISQRCLHDWIFLLLLTCYLNCENW